MRTSLNPPFGLHLGPYWESNFMSFRILFKVRFLIDFWMVLECNLAPFWVASLATFPDFAKNARPHENAINSTQIEGLALRKTIKNSLPKTIEKTM